MAKNTITQRIALDGGKTIEDRLKALGTAGEKAFDQIRKAAIKADLDKFSASLSKVGSDLATVGRRFALLGAGLTAATAAAGAALFGLAKSSGDVADQAGKAAEKTGLQVEAYGRLAFAAEQADVGNDQFVAGMSKLNKAISDAASKTTKIGDAFDASGVKVTRFGAATNKAADATKQTGTIFDRLGIKIRDANGNLRTNEAILLDVADAFARLPGGALKSALAIELFGKAGADLLPFLNEGKAGLFELGKQAERLGVILTKEQANIGDALGDSLDGVKKAAAGARLQLGLIFAPGLTVLANGFADLIAKNRDVLIAFGQAINQNVLSVVGDLLHLLSGNSQNVKNPWVKDWSAAIVQFGADVAGVFNGLVLPAFKALREGAQFVADLLNKVFGTDITAGELALGTAVLSLVGAFSLLASTVSVVVAGIGLLAGAVGGIPLAIGAALIAAGVALVVFWDEAKAGAAAGWQYISDAATAAWQSIVNGSTDLWSQIVGAFQQGRQMAIDAFNGIVEAIVAAWSGLIDRLGQIAQQIAERIVDAFRGITARISSILNGIVDIAQSILSRVSSLVDSVISKIKSAIAFAKQLAGLGGGDSGGGGSSASGFAGGGSVRGPGGPTGDRIPAWLSDKEFVMQAKAVRKYGTHFMYAVNNGLLSLKSLRMPSFNVGGMLDGFNRSLAIPQLAGGGFANMKLAPSAAASGGGGTMHVKLDFGLRSGDIFDMVTDNYTATRFQQFALKEANSSAGRAPSRGK